MRADLQHRCSFEKGLLAVRVPENEHGQAEHHALAAPTVWLLPTPPSGNFGSVLLSLSQHFPDLVSLGKGIEHDHCDECCGKKSVDGQCPNHFLALGMLGG